MKALLGCVTEVYNNYKDRISQPNKSGSFGQRGTGMGAGEAPPSAMGFDGRVLRKKYYS